MHLDLIIRGGTVLDGSGGPGVRVDVGIRDDEIVIVDDLSAVENVEKIDAAGHCVAPGFIDIHTHSDMSILNYPDAQSRVRQGITTEVVGNCSYSPFPVTEEVRKFIAPRLSDQNVDAQWPWQDVAGYREVRRSGEGHGDRGRSGRNRSVLADRIAGLPGRAL